MKTILTVAVMLTIIGLPLWYKVNRTTSYRNLRVVDEGKLYRSGQMTEPAFERFCKERGIRMVISVREDKKDGQNDDFEEEYCKRNNLEFRRLPIPDWEVRNGRIPAEDTLKEFFALMDDPQNHPALVHCFAGEHRTGALVAAYRIEYNKWPNDAAVEEMIQCATPRTTFANSLTGYFYNYKSLKGPVGGNTDKR